MFTSIIKELLKTKMGECIDLKLMMNIKAALQDIKKK